MKNPNRPGKWYLWGNDVIEKCTTEGVMNIKAEDGKFVSDFDPGVTTLYGEIEEYEGFWLYLGEGGKLDEYLIGLYNVVHDKIQSRAEEILELHNQIQEKYFGKWARHNIVEFASVNNISIYYYGIEIDRCGDTYGESLYLPSRYLWQDDSIVLADMEQNARDELEKQRRSKELKVVMELERQKKSELELLQRLKDKYPENV